MNSTKKSKSIVENFPWLQGNKISTLQCLAGHEINWNLNEIYFGGNKDVRWQLGKKRGKGEVINWVPRSPGIFLLRLMNKNKVLKVIRVIVGIKPSDILERADKLDYFFCLIVRYKVKLYIVPILASRDSRVKVDLGKLKSEVGSSHSEFAKLMQKQSTVYRKHVKQHPFVDLNKVSTGLYAIFSHDVIYLGNNSVIAKASKTIIDGFTKFTETTTGRGFYLKEIQKVVEEVRKTKFSFDKRAFYRSDEKIPSKSSIEKFAGNVISSLAFEFNLFGKNIGFEGGLSDLNCVMTFNGANGCFSSRLFDFNSGVFRQVTSSMDVFNSDSKGGFSIPGNDKFGRGGGGLGLGNFNGSSGKSGGLGGFLDGTGFGPLGGMRGQSAMDSDGGDIPPGADVDGKYEVQGDDGSVVRFDYGPDGNPAPSRVDTSTDGTEIWYGSETIWDYGDEEGTEITGGEGEGGDEGGGEGEGEGGDEGADEGGGEGEGEGGDEGGDEGGGEGEGEGGEPPSGSDPDAGMTNPDGTGGGGDTDGGDEGQYGGRKSGSYTRIPANSIGVITRGGGYTDPSPEGDDNDGVNADGGILVVPGGGVSDPPNDQNSLGGFAFWGGYNPPFGGESDPLINPTSGYISSENSLRCTVATEGNVRIEMMSGISGCGMPSDGLFSAGMAEGPERNTGNGNGNEQNSTDKP